MTTGEFDLYPGEELRWTGRPTRYLTFDVVDAVLIAVGLLWFGFQAVFFFTTSRAATSRDGAGLDVTMVVAESTAFVLVLGGTIGRPFLRSFALRRTRYAVTNLRAIRVCDLGRGYERSVYLKSPTPPQLRKRPTGTGTIVLGSASVIDRALGPISPRRRLSALPTPLILWEIDDAVTIRDLIATTGALGRREPFAG
ncbi:hypothetical protein [Amycolatopsis sp. CA-230715]|uniref:hypothetical protein n=1 Tax=Amycolatopsis sp. CA-230715 TaxID=2745196 RepID=UPI001C011FFB|nr:hypothetical protein [Amycolatopsis sp. CA-230715]QWF82552.1 hypothetical protein HUW46_05990 [Amycolatopsis sp. CA-230715]